MRNGGGKVSTLLSRPHHRNACLTCSSSGHGQSFCLFRPPYVAVPIHLKAFLKAFLGVPILLLKAYFKGFNHLKALRDSL